VDLSRFAPGAPRIDRSRPSSAHADDACHETGSTATPKRHSARPAPVVQSEPAHSPANPTTAAAWALGQRARQAKRPIGSILDKAEAMCCD
jgi:hypothetical protein